MNHSFDIAHAQRYGVDEAIMIGNFQYWINKNQANARHQYDGRTWTYNSVLAFEKLFPYWTAKQIRRVLDSLVEQGVLMKGEYNKSVYDRTSWYAFVDESTFLYEQTDLPKWATQDVETGNSIPNINTDNKPNRKTNNKDDVHEKIQTIIARINHHANTSYRAETRESNKLISARLKSYSLEDALCVIDWMSKKWLKTDMAQYFNPVTLFREANFEKYLQNARANNASVGNAHVNNPDYKFGRMRYRPQSEFGSYNQYLKNCTEYGHTAKAEGDD
jgi:uncharacterized phage protein (TIGR02220 family)